MPDLLTADAPSIIVAFGPPEWGIFTQEGTPILTVNSVDSVEYARDYRVSDYPQEQGTFESYNKVQVPFVAKIAFLIGDTRVSFLNSVEQAVASLQLVTVVTPEIQYSSANLVHYGYRREARSGKTLIRVEVWCQEVRIINAASLAASGTRAANDAAVPIEQPPSNGESATPTSFPKAQSTNAATPAQSGQVQPIDPDAAAGTGGPNQRLFIVTPLPPK